MLKYCENRGTINSFSAPHSIAYSHVGLQDINLAYQYPLIYWQTACLTVKASADEEVESNKSTNYGRIAKAIGDMQHDGAIVALPDINHARFEFKPDLERNRIIFGLRGINGIGDDAVSAILANRPYQSLEDFLQKNTLSVKAVINLIKAGCFIETDNEDRVVTMHDYITWLTKKTVEPKTSLGMRNFDAAIALNILPQKFDLQKRLYSFRSNAFAPSFATKLTTAQGKELKNCYQLDYASRHFFEQECMPFLREERDYWYIENEIVVYKNRFEKWYETQMTSVREWLAMPQTLEDFNRAQYMQYACDVWNKYCEGRISRWEMDSLSYYYTEHELAHVNNALYNITDYVEIPEEPIVIGTVQKTNKATGEVISEWDKYQLFKIAGTVLDKNVNAHYITLLTTTGVVTVKFYDGAFAHYNKQLSSKLPDEDKKTIVEKSWFNRGTKLLITGIRRGDMFYPKRYYDSMYQHTVCLIEEVYDNGELQLKYERERV